MLSETKHPDGLGKTKVLVTAVAQAIGITFAGKRTPQDQLFDYLHNKSLLLILDNFEHLTVPGRGFLLTLLSNTDAVKIIVTSRERLNLTVEWTLPVGGLPALDSGAQDLFVQRARRLVSGFAVNSENDADVWPWTRRLATVGAWAFHLPIWDV